MFSARRQFHNCLIAAATQWPAEGVPHNPRGWLLQVALRRVTDQVRSEIARRNRETVAMEDLPVVVAPAVCSEPEIDPDDTLVLLFMCCHPSLSAPSVIALTLRAVGGLTIGEIVKAFLAKLYQAAATKTSSIPEKNYSMLKAAKLRDSK